MQVQNLKQSTIETLEQSVAYLKNNTKPIRAMSLDMKTLNSSH